MNDWFGAAQTGISQSKVNCKMGQRWNLLDHCQGSIPKEHALSFSTQVTSTPLICNSQGPETETGLIDWHIGEAKERNRNQWEELTEAITDKAQFRAT